MDIFINFNQAVNLQQIKLKVNEYFFIHNAYIDVYWRRGDSLEVERINYENAEGKSLFTFGGQELKELSGISIYGVESWVESLESVCN